MSARESTISRRETTIRRDERAIWVKRFGIRIRRK